MKRNTRKQKKRQTRTRKRRGGAISFPRMPPSIVRPIYKAPEPTVFKQVIKPAPVMAIQTSFKAK